MNAALNCANSEEFQKNFQKVQDYAQTLSTSSSLDEGVRLARDYSESLNQAKNYQEAHQAAMTHLDQVQAQFKPVRTRKPRYKRGNIISALVQQDERKHEPCKQDTGVHRRQNDPHQKTLTTGSERGSCTSHARAG